MTGVASVLVMLAGPMPVTAAASALTPRTPVIDLAGAVSVQIDGLAPVAPQPGDELMISGRISNVSDIDLRTVAIRLRVSPRPLVDRAEISKIISGRSDRTGTVRWNTLLAVSPLLPAGASSQFQITVPVSSLGFSSTEPAVQILSLEALADIELGNGTGPGRVGLTTTFLPWFPKPDRVLPTNVVWLWPLTAPPARDSDGVLLDGELGTSLSAGGRLRTLLDLARAAPVPLTYLVDPALLETVAAMSKGYQQRTATGGLAAGTAGAAATAWLSDLHQLASRPGAQVSALAYALPDVVAMHRAGLDLDLTRAVTSAAARAQQVLPGSGTGVMPWPADGLIDAGSLEVLRAAGARTVLLSSAALPPLAESNLTPDGVTPLIDDASFTAVLADARLSQALTMATTTPDEALLARQRLLAEVAATTLEQPGQARTIVAVPPTTWSPDPATTAVWLSALGASPWMRAASLGSLLALPAAGGTGPDRGRAEYRKRARAGELPASYLSRVADRRADLATFTSVTADPIDPVATAIEDAMARSESLLWRADLAGGRRLLTTVSNQLDELIAKVRVASSGTTTLPGETGVVPVVIANDLDQPVQVALRLYGTPAVRFEAKPFPAFTVAAHTKFSVEVPARVLGSGDVDVAVQLTTADGRAYGTPVTVVVRSTAYARAASWVVGGLLAILVFLLGVNFVRRRRTPAGRGRSTTAKSPSEAPGSPGVPS